MDLFDSTLMNTTEFGCAKTFINKQCRAGHR